MDLFHRRSSSERKTEGNHEPELRVIGESAVAGMVDVVGTRRDGTQFAFRAPDKLLNVMFTPEGIVKLPDIDENH